MKNILSLAALSFSTLYLGSCVSLSTSPSGLTISESANHSKLHVSDVQADVKVRGRIAETTLTLTFHNATDRTLEAKVHLPLPEGATITGYALDVNGAMRDGVLVDKELGRTAFENTIRQNIDPGLLEKTAGNNFRTRIYPVLPKSNKKLSLTYIQPLQEINGSLTYNLPVDFKRGVKRFGLKLDAPVSSIASNSHGLKRLPDGRYQHLTSYFKSNSPYTIQLSQHNTSAAISSKGRDGKTYFYLSHPNDPNTKLQSRPKPKHLQLVWDGSHSGSQRDKKAELTLLKQYLKHIGNTSVDLKVINNTLTHNGTFTISNGKSSSLISAIQSIPFDGSSNLNLINFNNPKYDATIYIGDGIQITESVPPTIGSAPVHVIHSGSQANFPHLRYLTERSGGALVMTVDDQAVISLLNHREKLIKVTGSGVSKTHISSRADHQQALGQVSPSARKLTLHFGFGNTITRRQSITLSRDAASSFAPSQLWAQQQIDSLTITPKKNRSTIVALSQKHRVVSDFTSLIVLDRIADYVRYRIVPPTSKLRKQYYAALKGIPAHKKQQPANLNHVHTSWKFFDYQFKNIPIPDQLSKRYYQNELDSSRRLFFGEVDTAWQIVPNNLFVGGGVPSIPLSGDVFSAPTSGLRSGDSAITRDSVDFFLNNPTRTPPSVRSSEPLPLTGSFGRLANDETRARLLIEPGDTSTAPPHAKFASFHLNKQQVDTSYFNALDEAMTEKEALDIYFRFKKKFGSQAGFYVDCSRFFFERGYIISAKRILSNLAEIDSESAAMLRILAHGYMQIDEPKLALPYYEKVKELRVEEPQSYRDLALALSALGKYQQAADQLWYVISRQWHSRFSGIELIALHEWNHIVAKHKKSIRIKPSQKRFVDPTQADMRVTITWDTDNSDMDLWVTDPKGVKVYYGNRFTSYSGVLSKDFTRGRGPEEFLLHKAQPGAYKIEVNYFGTRQQTLYGSTTLHVAVTTHWGKPNQQTQHRTIRLSGKARTIDIGSIIWK